MENLNAKRSPEKLAVRVTNVTSKKESNLQANQVNQANDAIKAILHSAKKSLESITSESKQSLAKISCF